MLAINRFWTFRSQQNSSWTRWLKGCQDTFLGPRLKLVKLPLLGFWSCRLSLLHPRLLGGDVNVLLSWKKSWKNNETNHEIYCALLYMNKYMYFCVVITRKVVRFCPFLIFLLSQNCARCWGMKPQGGAHGRPIWDTTRNMHMLQTISYLRTPLWDTWPPQTCSDLQLFQPLFGWENHSSMSHAHGWNNWGMQAIMRPKQILSFAIFISVMSEHEIS